MADIFQEITLLIKEYISPELVWFIPFLYLSGNVIKKSKRIDDTLIPNILIVLGIFLSALVSITNNKPNGWMQWVVLSAISIGQGGFLAAMPVLLNQIIKQKLKSIDELENKNILQEVNKHE